MQVEKICYLCISKLKKKESLSTKQIKTMAVIQMTDDRFEEVVLKSELPVVVDFGATWCGPCRKVEPIIEELSDEYEDKLIVVKCDVEECPGIAAKYGIMNIPTVLFFKGGQPVDKNVGAAPKKAFVEKLEKLF